MSNIQANKPTRIRANLLGDVRGELDKKMLDSAFYESPDYRTLIESDDRVIVVGRRGTGKSALAYRLTKHFERAGNTKVLSVAPDEHEIIGIRPLAQVFGPNFRTIRAGATIAWRYGLLMQIAETLQFSYKVKNTRRTSFWKAIYEIGETNMLPPSIS